MADLAGVAYGGVRCAMTDRATASRTDQRAGTSGTASTTVARRGPGARPSIVGRPQRSPSPAAAAAYGALDNHCPHQGGPLGEGSIENGLLRCPWHGYDYDPLTGTPPPGFTDAPVAFPVEVRDDGVYVALPDRSPHARTVSDVMVETLVAWGVDTRVRHGRPLQPRLRRRDAPGRGARRAHAHRHPPRGRGGVRAPAPTASSPAGRRPASRSPGRARPTCSPACTTPRSTGRRCSRSPARCRRRCSAAARSRTST